MAVVNKKSDLLTKLDGPGIKLGDRIQGRAPAYFGTTSIEKGATDSANSTYIYFRVTSNLVITKLELTNDAITGATDYDVGLYEISEGTNVGAVINKNLFADALDLTTARNGTTAYNVRFQNSNIDTCEKELWELLGLTADPIKEYDICITANTPGSTAGTIGLLLVGSV